MQTKYKYENDSPFVAKGRALQNAYRQKRYEEAMDEEEKKRWMCGPGPHATSEIYYGNILLNGEVTGNNFLSVETFEYAKDRVAHIRKYETIQVYRLFCNMLSSQPMAFNLFHPMMRMLERVETKRILEKVLRRAFPKLDIAEVYSVDLEYIPEEYEKYLGDKTAMDAVIRFVDSEGCRNFIAVETKYTDDLGTNESRQSAMRDRARKLAEEYGVFAVLPNTFSQLYRNFLLTETVCRVGDAWGPYKEAYTWILAPAAHPHTVGETEALRIHLKPQYRYKVDYLVGMTLEAFTNFLVHAEGMPQEYRALFSEFQKRYLDGWSDEIDAFQWAVRPHENVTQSSGKMRKLKLRKAAADDSVLEDYLSEQSFGTEV